MSIRALTQRPQFSFGFGQQAPGIAFPASKPVQPTRMPLEENPFRQAQLQAQQPPADQLGQFMNLMQGGLIKPNLNKPALPYTASKGWSA